MSDIPRMRFEDLPDWARSAIEGSLPEPATPVTAFKNGTAWPLLVDAAVVSAFLPSKLGAEMATPARRDAEQAVLTFAEQTIDAGGLRWSLNRDARRTVLNLARRSGDLGPALKRTSAQFDDSVSVAMRQCLDGRIDLGARSLKTLEATRIAVGLLTGVDGVSLPPADDLDREVQLKRLLAQFERMVGDTSSNGGPDGDHFVGRDVELERLRRYVGVVGPSSLGEVLGRGAYYGSQAFSSWAPLAVTGVGGVGKTTLVAKFMLEHARAAASRFPFAYIDFDRPTISARNRSGIFAEMTLQVAAQFAPLRQPMLALRDQVRELGRKLETTDDGESIGPLRTYIAEFRSHIDRHLNALESRFERARPFLLVLDTYEIVQYSQDDESALQEFVEALSDGASWKRLRVVASGRRPIDFLVTRSEPLPLSGLEPPDAVKLFAGHELRNGTRVSARDARSIVDLICEMDPRVQIRLKPQRLCVIRDALSSAEYRSTGVEGLLRDLREDARREGSIGSLLIDGILIRRTLGNVADDRVRALADPGLVVRRITPDVVREVMTRETPRPVAGRGDAGDPETFEPWLVTEQEAAGIFDAFAREVTLVDIEGSALRHRQDVRQDMLPLIRLKRPARFAALHRRAFDYFRTLADHGDDEAAEEAVYHGLWTGAPLETVDAYWRDTPAFDPRIDAEEFDRGSLPDVYLRARTNGKLAPDEITRLPQTIALRWLTLSADDLIKERRPAAMLATIKACTGSDFRGLDENPDLAAIVARMSFRNGQWHEALELTKRHLTSAARTDASVSLFRTFATLAGKASASPQDLAFVAGQADACRDPLVRVEALAHATLGQRALSGRRRGGDFIQPMRAAAVDVPRSGWLGELRCLRLALLTVPDLPRPLLDTYLGAMERLPHDAIVVPTLARLLSTVYADVSPRPRVVAALRAAQEGVTSVPPEALDELDRCWRQDRELFMRAIARQPELVADMRWLIVFQHFDWTTPMGNAMTAACARDASLVRVLQSFKLPRSGSWVAANGQVDGLALMQAVADGGRLLDLASLLEARASDRRPAEPDDVVDIASALLRWHRAIVDSQDLRL